ncbi:MAG: C25 family cysteine peptidase [Chloroflexi bacterium]|nr:C25 family cysteine peptidase [Chloroflexota bacterium]
MRVQMRCLLLLAMLAALLPAPAAIAAPAAAIRVRLGVTTDGLYRLTPTDLTAAGVDLATIDPYTFSMESLGSPTALRVTGATDGRFDAGDFIEFFGQKFRGPEMEQKYTDERVYWLVTAAAPGPRVPDVDATPAYTLTPPADFPETVHAEQSLVWWTLHTLTLDTQDTWFWARVQPAEIGAVVTQTFPYTVPFPAPGLPATLRLEEIARSWDDHIAPDHRTAITLGNTALVDQTWDGKVRQVFTTTVPAGVLVSGANTVTVAALNPPGIYADDIYVNYWEIDYRRQFRAWDGRLAFPAEATGAHEYLAGGWNSAAVAIWDISDPAQPQRLIGATAEADGAAVRLRFRAEGAAGARYWLQEESRALRPASIRLRPPTGLRAPLEGADVVIVAPAEFTPAADRLAAWHRAHGRRALIADIQDVYDEFNEGIYHPKAVPAMLTWAAGHWPSPAPAYLTLLGDGHWNFKGFNPAIYPPQPNPIPPYLAWADPWQGEVPADARYGDLDGDDVPDVAVGRLAVNTLAEAQTVVDKIVSYDETLRRQPWQQRALFVADNPDESGDYPALSDDIIATRLPADLRAGALRIYLGQTVPDAASGRAAIAAAINDGVLLVQYTGHGAPTRWTHESIWRTADVPGLHNAGQLPIVMTFNCLDGYFALSTPADFSMAEIMQRQAGGGSLAAISPSGLTLSDDMHAFRRILMDVFFKDGVRELGRALTIAKQRFYAQYGMNYLISTMTLFGDPALQMPVAPVSRYLPLAPVKGR